MFLKYSFPFHGAIIVSPAQYDSRQYDRFLLSDMFCIITIAAIPHRADPPPPFPQRWNEDLEVDEHRGIRDAAAANALIDGVMLIIYVQCC